MTESSFFRTTSAYKLIAVSFGILGGIGSAVHGIGEIQQGNVRPDSVFISSWAEGPIALYYDGDPGITLIPNFLATGIACVIVSLFVILWSSKFLGTRRNGAILLASSIVLLLIGGGVGPPVLLFFAGLAALRIRTKVSYDEHRRISLKIWPYIFTITLANGIFLVIGHIVAAYYFAPVNGDIFSGSFLLSVFLLILAVITANRIDGDAL